jgi:hypothetical protein
VNAACSYGSFDVYVGSGVDEREFDAFPNARAPFFARAEEIWAERARK